MRSRVLLLLLASALAQSSTAALASPFEKQFTRVIDFGSIPRKALVAADFTGDGIDEVFFANTSDVPLLIALSQQPAQLRVESLFQLSNTAGAQTELHVWQGSSGPLLVAATAGGAPMARVYAGWPLREVSAYPLAAEFPTVAVGDLDADGGAELVLRTSTQAQVLRLLDGQPLWTLAVSSYEVRLADLDLDPALEMVFSGASGVVYDGLTRLPEWSYPEGFGGLLVAGNIVGSSAGPGFVGRNANRLTVFHAAPWSPVFEHLAVNAIEALGVVDTDGAGSAEIIYGTFNSLKILDTQSLAIRRSIAHFGATTIRALATGNQPGKDLLFSPGAYGSALSVARASSGATLYELPTEFGATVATSIGDLDADGGFDLVVASANSVGSGRIRTFSRDEGIETWVSPLQGGDGPLFMRPRFLFQSQLDIDPAAELIVAGSAGYAGRILVIDGATKAIQLVIGNTSPQLISFREIVGALLVDYDNDGFNDLAIATAPLSTSDPGVRLHVFSLQTGSLLWQSVRMGPSPGWSRGLFLQQRNGQRQLVAALPEGLRAYGVDSQLLEWTHAAPVSKAIYLEHTPFGPEILLQDEDGTISHLDPDTRAVRRTYQLPGPGNLIVPVPGAPLLLVSIAGSLALYTMDGALRGRAPGVFSVNGTAPVSIAARGAGFDVLVGTAFGFMVHNLDPDVLVRDGFERE